MISKVFFNNKFVIKSPPTTYLRAFISVELFPFVAHNSCCPFRQISDRIYFFVIALQTPQQTHDSNLVERFFHCWYKENDRTTRAVRKREEMNTYWVLIIHGVKGRKTSKSKDFKNWKGENGRGYTTFWNVISILWLFHFISQL